MAYRRRQQIDRDTTFREKSRSPYNLPPLVADDDDGASSSPSASSIAAKAIRASSANRDSSLSSAYGQSAVSPRTSAASLVKDTSANKYVPRKTSNELKQGFWAVLARKTKSILDDNTTAQHEAPNKPGFQLPSRETGAQYDGKYQSSERRQMTKSPTLEKGLGAIASSLDYIGGRIGNALEEGLSVVENRTADIIQETRKLQIKRKGHAPVLQNENSNFGSSDQLSSTHTKPQMHTDLDIQLKASRDVAMAMAAKAKLLLRELKSVKADLAFAKDRCAQLEEENKFLRESREKGENPEDDDLIRLQLESLLAEKARLAQENSILARENRFLREVVEYHQLTMQDVVYLDESSEEVTEIYPVRVPSVPNLQPHGSSLYSPPPGSSPSPTSSNALHTQLSTDGSFLAYAPQHSEETTQAIATQLSEDYPFLAFASLDSEGTTQCVATYIHMPEDEDPEMK